MSHMCKSRKREGCTHIDHMQARNEPRFLDTCFALPRKMMVSHRTPRFRRGPASQNRRRGNLSAQTRPWASPHPLSPSRKKKKVSPSANTTPFARLQESWTRNKKQIANLGASILTFFSSLQVFPRDSLSADCPPTLDIYDAAERGQ